MALRDLDPEEHLRDPARKQRYVTTVFDTIAPKYDRFTRLFSLGMDKRWKRQLAAWVAEVVQPGDVVVDLACGTGDVVCAIDRGIEGSRDRRWERLGPYVVGLDPSAEMLGVAKGRVASPRTVDPSIRRPVALLRADILSLPLAPASVAAVTVGYGFRNVPDAGVALAEVARVVRPGGWLFDLDFFRPERPGWRRLYLWYLRAAGRAVGRWWHREPEAYGYIARSIECWVTPPEFEALLERAGFRVDCVVRHLGGGICLHRAQRLD
jgi:demethylmenaquinone methyltransferase/2-methoxy-6-polyprenyl-1,4-benzoquinol methylase